MRLHGSRTTLNHNRQIKNILKWNVECLCFENIIYSESVWAIYIERNVFYTWCSQSSDCLLPGYPVNQSIYLLTSIKDQQLFSESERQTVSIWPVILLPCLFPIPVWNPEFHALFWIYPRVTIKRHIQPCFSNKHQFISIINCTYLK